jgi:hypothetical protein
VGCSPLPLRLAHVLLEIAENPKPTTVVWSPPAGNFLTAGGGRRLRSAMEAEDPLELDGIPREVQKIADELRARRAAKT